MQRIVAEQIAISPRAATFLDSTNCLGSFDSSPSPTSLTCICICICICTFCGRLNGFEETREGQSMKQNLSLKIVTIAGELSRGRCCAICKQNRFNTKGAYRWWCPMLHCNVQQILNWMRQILDHQLNFSSNISSNKVKHIEPPFQNVGWCQISTK